MSITDKYRMKYFQRSPMKLEIYLSGSWLRQDKVYSNLRQQHKKQTYKGIVRVVCNVIDCCVRLQSADGSSLFDRQPGLLSSYKYFVSIFSKLNYLFVHQSTVLKWHALCEYSAIGSVKVYRLLLYVSYN